MLLAVTVLADSAVFALASEGEELCKDHLCPAGQEAKEAKRGPCICVDCAAGKFQAVEMSASTKCTDLITRCSAGLGFTPGTAKVDGVCAACRWDLGEYLETGGTAQCKELECPPGYSGDSCDACLYGFYNRNLGSINAPTSPASCHLCPPGGVCPGGPPASAAVFAPKGYWIDGLRTPPGEDDPVIYACFSNHCTPIDISQHGCAAHSDASCCLEGHGGLLCESCSDGYIKQKDACIACNGTAWQHAFAMFSTKSAALLLVNAQLLNKASTKSCALRLISSRLHDPSHLISSQLQKT